MCLRTVRKWVGRYQAEGRAGLLDRSSRPHRSPNKAPADIEARVAELRRRHWTGAQIAQQTGLSKATVRRVLRRPIQVKSGDYLGEDNIVRLADDYGRTGG